ncbi:thioredoxin family protein [Leptothermofonsia sichuanensis E412]|jgi:thioredoxin 1|uniref:thioredoxin family protein n=1 Tax=Leptothermofonsia sichuanensis TaxID=2917832 RepID=UPI001CA62923|nr:thioredoxin family protein [Leptothermofonsia sichuanensis]QZZ22126.1 thioredoxin family protein [Leptothermofonsia sichuanensis E412]
MGEQTFEREVLESTTPVLVHFGAPWCGPCRMIEPLLNRFQSEWNKGFKFIGINADENLKLSSYYRITTLPTILFFQGGKVIHRLEGLYKRDDLQVELQKFMGMSLQTSASTVSTQPLKPLR